MNTVTVKIDRGQRYQTMRGFGASGDAAEREDDERTQAQATGRGRGDGWAHSLPPASACGSTR